MGDSPFLIFYRTGSSTIGHWSRLNILLVFIYTSIWCYEPYGLFLGLHIIILQGLPFLCVHFHYFFMYVKYLTSFDGLF